MFPNIDIFTLKTSLLLFKLSGIAPFTLNISKTFRNQNRVLYIPSFRCSSASTIYNLTLIITCLMLNTYLLYYMSGLDRLFESEIVHVIEIALGLIGIFVMLLIWSYFTYHRRAIVDVANQLVDIDMILAKHDLRYYQRRHIHFVLIIILNTAMSLILLVIELISHDFEIVRIFVLVLPIFVASFTITQYALVLHLLKPRFQHLNRALGNILKEPSEMSFIPRQPVAGKIVDLRRVHGELWELCQRVADFYSIPVLFTMILMSGFIIYSAYDMIIPFVLPLRYKMSILTVSAFTWFMMQSIPIVVMTTTISGTIGEMKKVSHVIHKIIAQNEIHRVVRIQLRDFSFEMIEKKINFTACHLFPLDCTLLPATFSMTMAYLIILLQLKSRVNPKLDHVHHHNH
ncbi:putative gustatory receptor 28b [Diachasma alloeum]|uniref:Gustatory receptor n=1 Tax=Diachasma alloeum TaxID=454923 RepID=A0A4E0RLE1_9HYME|nr:putative gustatory receptor 28b [Diachasma alloeum]THK32949.1 gustatory receptor 37 [Diachasma alloeum]